MLSMIREFRKLLLSYTFSPMMWATQSGLYKAYLSIYRFAASMLSCRC